MMLAYHFELTQQPEPNHDGIKPLQKYKTEITIILNHSKSILKETLNTLPQIQLERKPSCYNFAQFS